MRHTSFRRMHLDEQLRQAQQQLRLRRERLEMRRSTLQTQAAQLQRLQAQKQQMQENVTQAHRAQRIAMAGLQDRQGKELQALHGVLPLRVSGVAQRSRRSMQVRQRSFVPVKSKTQR